MILVLSPYAAIATAISSQALTTGMSSKQVV